MDIWNTIKTRAVCCMHLIVKSHEFCKFLEGGKQNLFGGGGGGIHPAGLYADNPLLTRVAVWVHVVFSMEQLISYNYALAEARPAYVQPLVT